MPALPEAGPGIAMVLPLGIIRACLLAGGVLQLQLMMPTGRFRHHADRTARVNKLLVFNVLFLNVQFQSRQLLHESRYIPVWRSQGYPRLVRLPRAKQR